MKVPSHPFSLSLSSTGGACTTSSNAKQKPLPKRVSVTLGLKTIPSKKTWQQKDAQILTGSWTACVVELSRLLTLQSFTVLDSHYLSQPSPRRKGLCRLSSQ